MNEAETSKENQILDMLPHYTVFLQSVTPLREDKWV